MKPVIQPNYSNVMPQRILTRYQQTSEDLLKLVTLRPDQYDHAQSIMQSMFAEKIYNAQPLLMLKDKPTQHWLS
jgi:FtsZ-interacting cell division protein YlmF